MLNPAIIEDFFIFDDLIYQFVQNFTKQILTT